MVGARKAETEHPGLLLDTVQQANEDISFKPAGGGGGAVDAGAVPSI